MEKLKKIAGKTFLIAFGIVYFGVCYISISEVIRNNPEFIAFIITAIIMYLIIKFIRS